MDVKEHGYASKQKQQDGTQLRIPGENPKSNISFMDVKERGYASKQKQQDG